MGELIQFLQAEKSMRSYISRFAEVKAPLQALMDERLGGTLRMKHMAKRRPLGDED